MNQGVLKTEISPSNTEIEPRPVYTDYQYFLIISNGRKSTTGFGRESTTEWSGKYYGFEAIGRESTTPF